MSENLSNMKPLVMMIDDDVLTNKYNTLILKKQHPDADIISFISASEGLNYLKDSAKTLPDIIFLDLNMPVMNGFDFMEEFKLLNLDIEVVIVTSSANPEDEERSRSFKEVSDYIIKPLDLNTLKKITKSFWNRL